MGLGNGNEDILANAAIAAEFDRPNCETLEWEYPMGIGPQQIYDADSGRETTMMGSAESYGYDYGYEKCGWDGMTTGTLRLTVQNGIPLAIALLPF